MNERLIHGEEARSESDKSLNLKIKSSKSMVKLTRRPIKRQVWKNNNSKDVNVSKYINK